MDQFRQLYYSSLCDTDLTAYLSYLALAVNHGSGDVVVATVDGATSLKGCDGSGVDVGDSVDNAIRFFHESCKGRFVRIVAASSGVGGVDGVSSCCVGGKNNSGGAIEWLSDCGAGDSSSCVSGGARNSGGGTLGHSVHVAVDTDASLVKFDVGVERSGGSEIVAEKNADVSGCSDKKDENGDNNLSHGSNLERNRAWRAQRKERKQRRQLLGLSRAERSINWRVKEKEQVGYQGAFGVCTEDVRKELAETRAACLIAKNKLACVKAQRQEELLLAQDLEKLKKRNETKVMRETEVNKVAVEKAFGTLAATGNVSSSDTTSGSGIRSGTISPNSSISEAEVRKLQKDVIDTMKNNDALVRRMEQIEIEARHGTIESVRKVLDTFCDAVYAKSAGITVDEDGEPVCGTGSIYEGYTDDRGRFHFGQKYTDDFFY